MVEKLNAIAPERKDPDVQIVNGTNVFKIPFKDPYCYGLQLMDIIFSKQELADSPLFKSSRSERLALDQKRVGQLLDIMERRCGENWNLHIFTTKANQKCRHTRL